MTIKNSEIEKKLLNLTTFASRVKLYLSTCFVSNFYHLPNFRLNESIGYMLYKLTFYCGVNANVKKGAL